ncbi:unnamed protein product [Prorocentrum cordatum]|uniref:Uncharacterized protein n=1 Tax=Prorocentrum cordatum TaxID=2364126 RepID=A0ABN9RVI4_9DINO|nr:unnamed protein product [Polarella glacialis]
MSFAGHHAFFWACLLALAVVTTEGAAATLSGAVYCGFHDDLACMLACAIGSLVAKHVMARDQLVRAERLLRPDRLGDSCLLGRDTCCPLLCPFPRLSRANADAFFDCTGLPHGRGLRHDVMHV